MKKKSTAPCQHLFPQARAIVFALLFFWIGFLSNAQTPEGRIYYVGPQAHGTGDGSSWLNPSRDLPAIINGASAGDKIFVAIGRYSVTDHSFVMKEGVEIYGGFQPEIGITDLTHARSLPDSVSIYDEKKIMVSILDGKFDRPAIWNYRNGLTRAAVLDGFSLINCDGGAILNYESSPTLRNLLIEDNQGINGAGIRNKDAAPFISHVILRNNTAIENGGAIYNENSNPEIVNTLIHGNAAFGEGGGVYNVSGNPTFVNVTVIDNSSFSGTAVVNAGGLPRWINSIVFGGFDGDAAVSYSLVAGRNSTTDGNLNGVSIQPGALFVNPASNNYRLLNASVVINKGNSSLFPGLNEHTVDSDRKPRVIGGEIDLGAYESLWEYPTVLHVRSFATGNGSGESWNNATANLQEAINGPNAKTVLVAVGTYNVPAVSSFIMKDGVAIYGGFDPNNGINELSDRRIMPNAANNNGSILNGLGQKPVVRNEQNGLSSSAVLDGFMITGGAHPAGIGGGIINSDVAPTFSNIVVRGNSALKGGGIANQNANPSFVNVIVTNNTAAAEGGGFYNDSGNPVLSNVIIADNIGTTGSAVAVSDGSVAIRNSIVFGTLEGNYSAQYSFIEGNTVTADGNMSTSGIGLEHLFTNAATRDFTTKPTSPAINKGSNAFFPGLTAGSRDLALNQRVTNYTQGGAIDLGPYEYNHVTPDANGIVYVKKGSVDGAGNSWESPLGEMADALRLAYFSGSVRQIWVAKGTYKPLYSGDDGRDFADSTTLVGMGRSHKERTFLLLRDLKIYGGFDPDNGITNLTHQRIMPNLKQNELGGELKGSILSGDFNNDDYLVGTGSDFEHRSYEENAHNVLLAIGDARKGSIMVTSSLVFDGFTVRGGASNSTANDRYVGGVQLLSWKGGGGIFAQHASRLNLSNISFYSNTAGQGGAVFLHESQEARFSDVSFYKNYGEWGVLINLSENGQSRLYLNRITLAENIAGFRGLIHSVGPIDAIRSTFYGNKGGPAIHIQGRFSSNIASCLFYKNLSGGLQHGGSLEAPFTGVLSVRNSTIVDNGSYGIVTAASGGTTVTNSIFTNNEKNHILQYPGSSNLTVRSSIIHSSHGATGNGLNSRNIDPLFVDAENGNYRLKPCSPAIDAGINSNLSTYPTDIEGNPRAFNSGITDIGAYEYQGSALTGESLLAIHGDQATIDIPVSLGRVTGFTADCRLLLMVEPNYSQPVAGSTTAKAWVNSALPTSYVRRRYEVIPADNPANATGKLILYYTQADFDVFNAANSLKLPQNPGDSQGYIPNLIIEKRGGAPTDNTGSTSSYPGTPEDIVPTSVVWSPVSQVWEVTVRARGMGGFFLKTSLALSPNENGDIYVKTTASGSGLGNSWANATKELQRAIDTEGVRRVLVAKGTYFVGVDSYMMKEGVAIYGGFDPDNGIVDLTSARIMPNAANTQGSILSGLKERPVVWNKDNHLTSSAILDGFTITEGDGGGIYNESVSPTYRNLVIRGNTAVSGGGLLNVNGEPRLIHAVVVNNKASYRGGGIATGGATSFRPILTLLNVTVADNQAPLGGGVYYESGVRLGIYNSIIWNGLAGNGILQDLWHSLVPGSSNTSDGNVNASGLTTSDVFVDPAGGDYTLKSCSPAINAGLLDLSGMGLPTTDLAGQPRVFADRVDLGAYENRFLPTSLALSNIPFEAQGVQTKNGTTHYYNNCNEVITSITTTGLAGDISGTSKVKTWVDNPQPHQYVRRHFEITPRSNANSATGRVTLYFTQADFDAFNAVNSVPLPTGPTDNVTNLRVEKRGGVSSDGSGAPNSYPGAPETVSAGGANLAAVWNNTLSRWEVSFDVQGFSGFFVKTTDSPLPVRWISFEGSLNDAARAELSWEVDETNVSHYELEKSQDARRFVRVTEIKATGEGKATYTVTDPEPLTGTAYYRLRQVDRDGTFSFSRMISLAGSKKDRLRVYPNPVNDMMVLEANQDEIGSKVILMTLSGVVVKAINLTSERTTFDARWLAPGGYLVKYANGHVVKVIKN